MGIIRGRAKKKGEDPGPRRVPYLAKVAQPTCCNTPRHAAQSTSSKKTMHVRPRRGPVCGQDTATPAVPHLPNSASTSGAPQTTISSPTGVTLGLNAETISMVTHISQGMFLALASYAH